MFGKLQGSIEYIGSNFVILMAGGVGFKILLPSNILTAQTVGREAAFWIETIVREDAINLIGFDDQAQQDLFVKLTSVSGIGPRVALAILGAFGADVLQTAILSGDVKTLTSIPGVGKKVAERIIVELKGKVGASVPAGANGNVYDDVLAALETLGYRRGDVVELVQKLARENPDDTVQSLITKALKEYAGK
ncbi:MAG: Holliday junction branch migration protein RuvA [Rickettsiales bacterium]|jgi:Holliday junction DNA helicase RuvA|nr:Holliday junction branch migration protein RuvA [Rickettsiales bacterium]